MSAYSTAVLADSPSVYYRLDETSGTTITDSSGNARNATANATITGGVSLIISDPASGSITPSWRNAFKQADSTYVVGGVGTAIESWLNLTDLVIDPAATGYYAATAGVNILMASGVASDGWAFGVRSSDGAVYWAHQGAGDVYFTGVTIVPGITYHVVMIMSTTTATECYVNGQFVEFKSPAALIATTGALILNSALPGVNTSPRCALNGLDEIALYPGGLSAARIAAHYAAAITAGAPARDTHTAIPFTRGAGGGGKI